MTDEDLEKAWKAVHLLEDNRNGYIIAFVGVAFPVGEVEALRICVQECQDARDQEIEIDLDGEDQTVPGEK